MRRDTDKGVAARASGKARVARETVWAIEIGPLRLRCRPLAAGIYVVECKSENRWLSVAKSLDPVQLFATTVMSKVVNEELWKVSREPT